MLEIICIGEGLSRCLINKVCLPADFLVKGMFGRSSNGLMVVIRVLI